MVKRREVLLAGSGMLASAVLGERAVSAAEPQPHAHGALPAGTAAFTRAVAACVDTGNACLQHCLDAFATGDKTLAACADAVNQMLAICRAAGVIAVGGSRHRAQAIQLCSAICGDCEKECRKHEAEHAVCKACAEACAATVKAALLVTA
jgi:Cys-rich four helix bundle protein (predicted Tat secretion target)